MRIKYDTHLHTDFSFDSEATVASQFDRATELGLYGLCITDHIDYKYPVEKYPDLEGLCELDFDEYYKTLNETANQYPELDIMIGLECGLQTNASVVEYNKKICQNQVLDQIIGSIHLIDNNDPYYPQTWTYTDPKALIRRYFELTLNNINSFSGFDTLGHMDYAVRYAPDDFNYNPEEYFEITDEIMHVLIKKGIAFEINTSALKKGYGFTNPHPIFIKRYHKLGGRLITIGSDAHSPEAMAYAFNETAEQLIEYGFNEYVIFKKRKPIMIPIE